MFYWFLPCLFSFSGWCAGARIVRPVCFGLLWLSLCVRCLLVLVLFVWFFVCGVAGSCWPFVFAVVFSSVSLLVFAFGVWGCFGLARSLLASFPPALPAPSVSPLVPSGPVGALLVPPSGYLVVFATARLSCLWHGVL